MDCTELRKRLRLGEGLSTEFKRCGGQPGDDVFETVCSFANRQGGDIFLGVSDNGDVLGVPDKAVASIQRNIVNVANNPKLFNVAPVVEMEPIECEGKTVVRVWVPMGPAVYSYKGTTYDRMADADVRVAGVDQISLLYLRKQDIYSEQRVYPYVTLGDLRSDVIDKARRMALMRRPDHPWGSMSDEELLRSSKLYAKNRVTGQEGYTLAAVLLVGDDDVIGDVCPAYKTDAIVRRTDTDRYDDREVVRTNLVEAYEALFSFATKHLPDRFVLEGTQRVSVRDIIVRELVANTLMHREYISPFPAKLIVDAASIRTENASRSLYEGRLVLSDFNPITKNPNIARFFTAIGRAEELGSGFKNLHKYAPLYGGSEPLLEDGDVFRAHVATTSPRVRASSGDMAALIAALLDQDGVVTSSSLAKLAGVSVRTAQRHIKKLVESGMLTSDEEDGRLYRRG